MESVLQVPRNEEAPHGVVVIINYQVMQKLPTGELSGDPVDRGSRLLTLSGPTKAACQERLHTFLQEVANAARAS